jgi:hypothetical protein
MNYSNSFISALGSGTVMVRKAWFNQNSKNQDQVSVQCMQQIEAGDVDPSRLIVAAAQGINPNQRVTTIFSVKADVWEANTGLDVPAEDQFFCEEGQTLLSAEAVFGMDVDINVVENTQKNPLSPSQQPKMNPTTSAVLTKDGSPIYRHTTLVPKGLAKREFLAHDAAVTPQRATSAVQANAEFEEQPA